jgi:hypothetical protein
MKIKLTEQQYNRLLVENDKSFLDGKVDFPHIGNKVNKFIVKLFNYIYEKKGRYTPSQNWEIREMMMRDFGLTRGESKLLIHNYDLFSDEGVSEFSGYLDAPLEFWGEFRYNTSIPVQAYVGGYIGGWVTGHASNYDEFIEQVKSGDWEDIDSDWSEDIESYPEDAEWDFDSDYAVDTIGDEINDMERANDKASILRNIEIE